MKYLSLLIAVCAAAVLFCSCSVATSIHFNRNYSGDYLMTVDMSEALAMMAMFDSTGMSEDEAAAGLSSAMEELALGDILNETEGISNFSSEVSDDGIIMFSLEFDNVEALNVAYNTLQELGNSMGADMGQVNQSPMQGTDQVEFSRSGKEIAVRSSAGASKDQLDDLMSEGGEMADMMNMVSSMVEMTMEFTFKRKIKSFEHSGVDVLEQDKRLVKVRLDLEEIMQTGEYEMIFRLR